MSSFLKRIFRRNSAERQIRKIPDRRLTMLYLWYTSIGERIVQDKDKEIWNKIVEERERRLSKSLGYWYALKVVKFDLEMSNLMLQNEIDRYNEGKDPLEKRMLLIKGLKSNILTSIWSSRYLGFDLTVKDFMENPVYQDG